jgi:hypothetical protein
VTTRVILAEQIAEVGRELGLRRNVYPKWIAAGKLSQALADRQIACMEAAYETLKWLGKNEDRIKAMLKGAQS